MSEVLGNVKRSRICIFARRSKRKIGQVWVLKGMYVMQFLQSLQQFSALSLDI